MYFNRCIWIDFSRKYTFMYKKPTSIRNPSNVDEFGGFNVVSCITTHIDTYSQTVYLHCSFDRYFRMSSISDQWAYLIFDTVYVFYNLNYTFLLSWNFGSIAPFKYKKKFKVERIRRQHLNVSSFIFFLMDEETRSGLALEENKVFIIYSAIIGRNVSFIRT